MVSPFFDPENDFTAVYNFTCRGASHEKNNTVCQDASASELSKYYSMAVVCDGHGGADYFRSDRGSQLAVEAFSSCVADKDFIKRLDKADSEGEVYELATQLMKSVILRWNTAVEQDIAEKPITEEELEKVSEKARKRYMAGEKLPSIYGTTLIGFVAGRRYCFAVQIGDGKCVLANSWGQLYQPIPEDERCFLNVTTSLSDENAFEECRFWVERPYNKNFPIAVFLGSDGIDDSFAGNEKLYDFYRLILKNLAEDESEAPLTDLGQYLPTLSSQGSGDDMSLGILLRRDRIRIEPERWDGTGRQIYVYNSGDLDQDTYTRSYTHKKLIPAKVGSYAVPIGRYGERTVEVLSVDDEGVILNYNGEDHLLTMSDKLSFSRSERQATYDGPWHEASEITTFTLLC